MGGIQADGREHRHDVVEEIAAHPFGLAGIPVGAAQEADAFGGQGGQDGLVEEPVLVGDEGVGFPADGAEHLPRGQPVRTGQAPIGDLLLEACHPDLEELVQIAADDAQEAQPLQKRRGGVFRLGQDATVEGELGQLPVEEDLGTRGVVHGCRGKKPSILASPACPIVTVS